MWCLYLQEEFLVWRHIRRQTTHCLLQILERRKQLARYGTIALNGGNCVIKYGHFLPHFLSMVLSFISTVLCICDIELLWTSAPYVSVIIIQVICPPIAIYAISAELFSHEGSAIKDRYIVKSLVLWALVASATCSMVLACLIIAFYVIVVELFSSAFSVTTGTFTIERLMLWALITLSMGNMHSIGITIAICIIVAELLSCAFPMTKERFNINTINNLMSWALIITTLGDMYLVGMTIVICVIIAELFSYAFSVTKERFVMQKDLRASHRMLDVLKGLGVTSERLNRWAVQHPDTVSRRTQYVTSDALDRCGVFYTIRDIGGYSDDVTQPAPFEKGLYPDDAVIKVLLVALKLFGDKWMRNKSVFDVHQRMALLSLEMNALNHVHARCEKFLSNSWKCLFTLIKCSCCTQPNGVKDSIRMIPTEWMFWWTVAINLWPKLTII